MILSTVYLVTLTLGSVLLLSVSVEGFISTRWFDLERVQYNFENYVKEYGKTYQSPEEYHQRKAIFHENLNEIIAFNKRNESWKKGVNQFTDLRREEVRAFNGYRKSHTAHVRNNPHPQMAVHVPTKSLQELPSSVDWRTTGALTAVKDQASCGSCWAFSTSEVLESFYFLKTGKRMLVSPQQIASCTEIPQECWTQGQGGCQGSTQLLAYHAIMGQSNTVSEYKYPYKSSTGANFSCIVHPDGSPLRVTGYKVVSSNDYAALMDAVANVGPVSISVDARTWHFYESGVFTGCSTTSIDVDHAVQLVGYGTDSETTLDYWVVRNSWNVTWGENGFMRLVRNPKATCAQDANARDCMGGPTSSTVCGDCGILYDSSYPIVTNSTTFSRDN